MGSGNNPDVVKRVLKSRSNFSEVGQYNSYFHFNWQATSNRIKFERLINSPHHKYLVNHFEGQRELSSKFRLLKNLERICVQKQIYLFDITPITFVVDYESSGLRAEFETFVSYFLEKSTKLPADIASLEILRKKNFYSDSQDQEQATSLEKPSHNIFSQPKFHSSLFKGHNFWLIKPSDFNRGRGIKIFNTMRGLNECMLQYQSEISKEKDQFIQHQKLKEERLVIKNKNLALNTIQTYRNQHKYIIQKYIESPLLINGRKFDIRMWSLITHEMKLYIFK